MLRGLSTTVAILAVTAMVAAPAAAQEPVAPYDGSIPFRCELQNVGTGVDFPDPDADPFCVEFDKTQQSLLPDQGIIEFLQNEPARVAAASTKCFYFQRDHWTGSIIQGQPPELWNWEGNYWFDRARGVGGIGVRNFRLLGQPASMYEFVPDAYKPYFDPNGGGGVQVVLATDPDPICGARVDTPEEREQIYADTPVAPECVPPGGPLRGKRVGAVKLGMKRALVRERLGAPRRAQRGADRWCLIGAASLSVPYREGAAALIKTSSRGHVLRGVARGDRARRAFRRLGRVAFRIGATRVIAAGESRRRAAFAGVRGKRVRWVAVADPRAIASPASARRALQRTR